MSEKKTEEMNTQPAEAAAQEKPAQETAKKLDQGKAEIMKVLDGVQGAEKLADLIERGKKNGKLSAGELMDVLDGFAGPAVIRVSGYQFGEGTLPFAYTLQGQPAEVLQPGEVREHKTEITDGGISLQFFTAYHNQAIYTAADAAALRDTAYPAGSVVYLTADIAADVLTFDGRYPNLNLNGHTLAVDRLEIHAAAGVYTTMCVENGVLTIGGRTYRDGEQLPVSGDGHVALALRGLRDAQAG